MPIVATTATATSGVGTYPITVDVTPLTAANYSFTPVSGALTVTPAALTVTADDQSRAYGAGNPTLTFKYAGFVNGDTSAVIAGVPIVATTATATSGVGTYPITVDVTPLTAANYSFTPVSGALTVTRADTISTITSSINPVAPGQSVTFTATVLPDRRAPGAGTPTGSVTFWDNGVSIGTGTLNGSGVGSLTSTLSVIGVQTITASYAGDGNFNTSTSNTLYETVQEPTTTAVTSSAPLVSTIPTSNFGQSVTFTATVTPVHSVTPPPSGLVFFFED